MSEQPPPRRSTASVRDDKSDRWHEYNQQFRPDTLHRGIHVRLPDDLHDYVHDDSSPREQRAHVLAEHFADRGGLGQHWTPHTQIAHRSIWNAADAARSPGPSYEDDDNPEYNIDDYMEDHYHGGEDEDEPRSPGPAHPHRRDVPRQEAPAAATRSAIRASWSSTRWAGSTPGTRARHSSGTIPR